MKIKINVDAYTLLIAYDNKALTSKGYINVGQFPTQIVSLSLAQHTKNIPLHALPTVADGAQTVRYGAFFMALQPLEGQSLLVIEASRPHSDTLQIRHDSSGRMISPTQRPLPENTQLSQETGIHARGRIRTHNHSMRTVEDPRLRPRDHWDLLRLIYCRKLGEALKRTTYPKSSSTKIKENLQSKSYNDRNNFP
jgi:hypothetical protein